MKKVILMMGIPGSGKSTRAKELADKELPGSVLILNRDTIRQNLDIKDPRKREDAVKVIQKDFLIDYLWDPAVESVIIDDAGNLKEETQKLIQGWISESGVKAEIVFDRECLNTPVETCIQRDAKRPNGVGADVVRQWAQRHLPQPELPESVKRLPPCIILDVDGCLAIKGDRGAHEYEKAYRDMPNELLLYAIFGLNQRHFPFVILSGREGTEASKAVLESWIKASFFAAGLGRPQISEIIMRPAGDRRFALEFKKEAIAEIMKTRCPMLAIEDDPSVVQWMASQGIQVWAVHNASNNHY